MSHNGAGMVTATISEAFGLSGPSLAIDSACASSLQALLFAARALESGQIEMAIVGGTSTCRPDTLIEFSKARANSATGSRPFDADADGVVCAEGTVAIVVKTLERAGRRRSHPRGRPRLGSCIGRARQGGLDPQHAGTNSGHRARLPRPADVARLQYIEAHATSTQLGDLTEIQSLIEVLSQHLPPGRKIPVTSVKANIGHTLEAAGLAGLVKAVLCLQHRTIPAAINVRTLSPKIDWEHAPVFVPTQAAPWPAPDDGGPRRAGVNAFGLGGLNMHAVIDEFQPGATPTAATSSAAPARAGTPRDAEPIAIVGRGCVLPGAPSVKALAEMRINDGPPAALHLSRMRRVDNFEYDWQRHKIPPRQVAQADPLQFFLLDAVDQALEEAGCARTPLTPRRWEWSSAPSSAATFTSNCKWAGDSTRSSGFWNNNWSSKTSSRHACGKSSRPSRTHSSQSGPRCSTREAAFNTARLRRASCAPGTWGAALQPLIAALHRFLRPCRWRSTCCAPEIAIRSSAARDCAVRAIRKTISVPQPRFAPRRRRIH